MYESDDIIKYLVEKYGVFLIVIWSLLELICFYQCSNGQEK